MLPGFRFLFAAILLSTSILVFGLGAAALLRAAHEEFASTPSWRAAPEPKFAQRNEATAPVLAMLRVEQVVAEQKASDDAPTATAPAEPPAIAALPDDPDEIAALKPQDSTPPEAAKPEIPVPETSVQSEATPAPADMAASADAAMLAAARRALSPPTEATGSEPAISPASPDTGTASMKVAALADPPRAVEAQPPEKAASAKPDPGVNKKRLQARRAAQRRRIALRARLARQAAAQQAANPFWQPPITPRNP